MQPFKAIFKKIPSEYSPKPDNFKGLIVQITNDENSSDYGSDDKIWYIDEGNNKLEFVNFRKYEIFKEV